MNRIYKSLLVLALMLGASNAFAAEQGGSAGANPTVIEWEDLMPPAPEGDTLSLKDLSEQWDGVKEGALADARDDGSDVVDMNDPNADQSVGSHSGSIRPAQETAPVVKKYDGKRIKLAGYIVPLDFEATKIKKFLLVPYVGACIHVPPPPTNQVVYVESSEAVAVKGLFDPVYVTGTMSLDKSQTALAEAGYRIDATRIVPYE